MFKLKLGPLSAGLCAMLAHPAVAQDVTGGLQPRSGHGAVAGTQEKAVQDKVVDPFSRLESFVGARVHLVGDEAKDAPKQEKEDAPAVLVPSVARLVIDTTDGSIDCAVLDTGSWLGSPAKTILVPMSALRRDREVRDAAAGSQPELVLDATRERIATLPSFDHKDVDKRGLTAVVADAREAWEKSMRPSADGAHAEPASARRSDAPAASSSSLILSEQVRPSQVVARDGKFGSIKECFVDSQCQRLRFVVVTTEGTDLLMPFSVLHFVHRSDGAEWLVDQPAKSLRENGVEYKKPADRLIEPAAAQKAVDAYRISKR